MEEEKWRMGGQGERRMGRGRGGEGGREEGVMVGVGVLRGADQAGLERKRARQESARGSASGSGTKRMRGGWTEGGCRA